MTAQRQALSPAVAKEEAKSMEKEWRCKECETLLGVEQGARLHLRYKQAQYVIDGGDYSVIAVCRNCSTVNERVKPEGSSERATARA